MIKSRSNKGYLLLEVLIAVIVILGLTLWWVKVEVHNDQKDIGKVINQQINSILNAASNYYVNNSKIQSNWPAEIKIQTLIDKKYLLAKDAINPYGFDYKLHANYSDNTLELTTKVSHENSYVAYKAISSLADSSVEVSPNQNEDTTITVHLYQPAGISQPHVVKFLGNYYDGQTVSKDHIECPTNFTPDIIVTEKDHYNCVISATDDFSGNGWKIHSRKLNNLIGWVPCEQPVQVSLTCSR